MVLDQRDLFTDSDDKDNLDNQVLHHYKDQQVAAIQAQMTDSQSVTGWPRWKSKNKISLWKHIDFFFTTHN